MTSQEKKEYLLGYQRINQRVNCLLLEQQRWRELATRVSPNLSGMPGGGKGGGTQGAISKIVDLETEINAEIDKLVEKRKEIEGIIRAVEDNILRTLLEYRYINGKKWEEIALMMGYDYRYILKIHGKALSLLPSDLGKKKTLKDTRRHP
jgi:hypothetical protein|nr:MAG TPA: Protein of unknown function (DUF722) [Caudoviricetes sp.]